MQKRILFVGHEATSTGAPLYLLQVVGGLRQALPQVEIEVLLRRAGPLTPDFSQAATTWRLDGRSCHYPRRFAPAKGLAWAVRQVRRPYLMAKLRRRRYDLVYMSSLGCVDLFHDLSRFGCPIWTHVHELDGDVSRFPKEDVNLCLTASDSVLSTASCVTEMLTERLSVPRKKITERRYFVSPDNMRRIEAARHAGIGETRARYGIPPDAFVVGASGSVHARKGTDLFLSVAKEVWKHRPEINPYFIWVGDSSTPLSEEIVKARDAAGLNQRVILTGRQDDVIDWFRTFDVFALTSREEAFGIVGIENAALGTPVVTFDNRGDLPGFVGEDCGIVVPHLDVTAMAEAIESLALMPDRRHALGANAHRKCISRHNYESELAALAQILESTLNDTSQGLDSRP